VKEAAEGCAMNLAAHGAVTVVDELGGTREFEANLPAKTRTVNHVVGSQNSVGPVPTAESEIGDGSRAGAKVFQMRPTNRRMIGAQATAFRDV
jgi:hypothetical protein